MYDGLAQPHGCYASRLEGQWHACFKTWGLDAVYVGDEFNWADFRINNRIMVEIKPHGDHFAVAAANRALEEYDEHNLWIITGSPGFAAYRELDYNNHRDCLQTRSRTEFMAACGENLNPVTDPRAEEMDRLLEKNKEFEL